MQNSRISSVCCNNQGIRITSRAEFSNDFTVIDGANNKLRVSHNTTQMNQVFSDGVAIMQTKKNTLYVLLGNVDSAADEAAVAAIVWA